MGAAYIGFIAGTGGIMGQDIDATIQRALHWHGNEIGKVLEGLVREKTQILTGTLQESIRYDFFPGGNTEDICYIYAMMLLQIQEWNRVYVQYQEGGPLGVPTYTNDPVQMFLDTAEQDGFAAVEEWAFLTITDALGLCIAGIGIPI